MQRLGNLIRKLSDKQRINLQHFSLQAAVIACQKLKEKMSGVKEKMKEPSWLELVKKCHMSGVDLSAHHM